MDRDENVKVFRDTERQYKSNPALQEAVKRSVETQRIVLETDDLPAQDRNRFEGLAEITVSKKRTLEAAAGYPGRKVAVLNFASASNPGGGVISGANAQEECLCRCSTLYPALNSVEPWAKFYKPHRLASNPMHNDDIIYTPGVVVFKSDTALPRTLPEEDWYFVDVITCAAPNLNNSRGIRYNPGDDSMLLRLTEEQQKNVHEKRLRRILEVAISHGCDTLILGAFGCGAFRNSPTAVAEASASVISEYRYAFRSIEFAVYCTPGREENYEVFRTMGNRLKMRKTELR